MLNDRVKEIQGLEIPDWLGAKIYRDKGFRGVYSTSIYAIISETEKSYYAFIGSCIRGVLAYIPKSQCALADCDIVTYVCDDYSTLEELRDLQKSFVEWKSWRKNER